MIQAVADLTLAITVPLAIITFVREVRIYKRDSRIEAFNDIDDSFVALHHIMLVYPELNVSIYHIDKKPKRLERLAKTQKIRCCLIFDIQTSLFERAFFRFDNAPEDLSEQREGWNSYIALHCRNPLYREWWARENYGYDPRFSEYLTDQMQKFAS